MSSSKNTIRSVWTLALIALLLVIAGCSGVDIGSDPDTPTDQTAVQPIPEKSEKPVATASVESDSTQTPTETPEEKPTVTATPSSSINLSTEKPIQYQKYEAFIWSYSGALGDRNVSVIDSSVNPSNESITITYLLDLENLETQDFSLIRIYAFLAENYRTDTFESVDESYVPERVNHRAVLERDGELYRTTYVNESMANKYLSDEWNDIRYWAEFIQTLEYGPGSPHYTPTATEAESS
ncbi:hypothetical protein KTS45_07290 [Halomicroarcula limicola]|uniref:Lipoprotein n=1 Tax=Haloarcula limicola TaxID=1429915 RepID=A0A8J7YB44_9EURY|nr:hypothetical protein [Halomicroarcula limicola]MBV0924006.1 hypothetical protein [Halomicroarcula limicola]